MPILPDYELMLEQIYRAALRPGDIAVDIGAHEGRHTLPMARAVGPSGSVFAFEPLPNIALELRRVIEERGNADPSLGAIVLHQIALGENEGTERFVYLPDAPGFSGFQERVYPDESWRRETIDVQVRRLDAFGVDVRGARFIKVDAEGGELTILRGAAQVIDASMPIVSFELGNASLINYQYKAADYFDFFADRDYTVFSVFGIPLSREEFIAAADEQFFWDYIAIPGNVQWPFGQKHIRVCVDRLRHAAESSGGMQELALRDGQLAQVERDLAEARQQLGDCEGELIRTRQKLKAVQVHLAGVLSSWSWRVTEPARRVKVVLRRAFARWGCRSAVTPGTAGEEADGGSATVFGGSAAGALDIQALLTDIRAELGHGGRSGGELNSFVPPVPSALEGRFRAYWTRLPPRLRYKIGRTPVFLWAKDRLLRRAAVRRGP